MQNLHYNFSESTISMRIPALKVCAVKDSWGKKSTKAPRETRKVRRSLDAWAWAAEEAETMCLTHISTKFSHHKQRIFSSARFFHALTFSGFSPSFFLPLRRGNFLRRPIAGSFLCLLPPCRRESSPLSSSRRKNAFFALRHVIEA